MARNRNLEQSKRQVEQQRRNPEMLAQKPVEKDDGLSEKLKDRISMMRRDTGAADTLNSESEDRLPLTLATQFVPIRNIRQGIIETTDGRYVRILKVSPVNLRMQKEQTQAAVIENYRAYLRVAPAMGHIKSIASRSDMRNYLNLCREHKKMEPVETDEMMQLHDNYISMVAQSAREGVTRSFYMCLSVQGSGSGEERFAKAKKSLDESAETAVSYLKKCGNAVNLLKTHETAECLYTYYNRRTSLTEPFSCHLDKIDQLYADEFGADEEVPVREYIAPQEMDFRQSAYRVMDGTYYTYIMLAQNGFHTYNPAGWMAEFVNLGDGIDIDLFYERMSAEEIRSKISLKLKVNKGQASNTDETNRNASELTGAITSGRYLLSGIANGEDVYYMNLMITVSANSYAAMKYKMKQVVKLLKSRGYRPHTLYKQQDIAFNAAMPMSMLAKSLKKQTRRNTLEGGLAGAYPFVSYELLSDDGVVMGHNAENDSLLILDLFNTAVYKNANIAILGTTGAGKTYSAMLLLMRSRLCQIPVYIITPAKAQETSRACKAFGGSFISLSLGGEHNINPMELRKYDTPDEDAINEGAFQKASLLSQKTDFLLRLFKTLLPDITYDERQYADSAIVRTYARFGITYDDTSIFEADGSYKKMPLLSDLQWELYEIASEEQKKGDNDGAKGARRAAKSLNPLINGSASNFNCPTNVDLDNMFTVISIADLPQDMKELGLLVAIDLVYARAKEDRTKKKLIAFEELWEMIGAAATDSTATQVMEVFKIIRGYGGGAVAITQDVSDFMAYQQGKFGKGVLNACKTKIVLNLEAKEARAVQETLELTDREVETIIGMEKGKGLLIANNNNLVIDFKSTPLEHDLITTDRSDLERIAKEKQTSD